MREQQPQKTNLLCNLDQTADACVEVIYNFRNNNNNQHYGRPFLSIYLLVNCPSLINYFLGCFFFLHSHEWYLTSWCLEVRQFYFSTLFEKLTFLVVEVFLDEMRLKNDNENLIVVTVSDTWTTIIIKLVQLIATI